MSQLSPEKRALLALREMRQRLDALEAMRTGPIAVIGMGCRFPGGATSPDRFWSLLANRVDAVGEIPKDRWDAARLYDADPEVAGKMITKWGAFVDDAAGFDAGFFGISPREATMMDPQQRWALEVSREALCDAGITRRMLAKITAGVFFGVFLTDYAFRAAAKAEAVDGYLATGNSHSIVANRVSFHFDMKGPSVAVDTACSSSLVAVHLAAQSLRLGECDIAVAGGAHFIGSPEFTMSFSKAGMMAKDGRCKTFDAAADGYVRGEGCGAVVLKRLADAIRDGDRIRAVLVGSAVAQDGHTSSITAPNSAMQERVIRAAIEQAQVEPADVGYVEAHGTGTALGDPIEVAALGAVLSAGRDGQSPCVLSSVKTNIGHLEAAAGIAGFVKMVLALEKGLIPPTLHFHTPNPHLNLERLPLRVQTEIGPWPQASPRLGGVSSFGFGGTIAHVLLEESPEDSEERVAELAVSDKLAADGQPGVLTLSARSAPALEAYAAAMSDYLASPAAGVTHRDVCLTTSARRDHFEHRLAVVGSNLEELATRLREHRSGGRPRGVFSGVAREGRPRVIFVFAGQGSQWWAMGHELRKHEPVFKDAFERVAHLVSAEAGWSLLDELDKDEASSRIMQTSVAQPALFALEVALTALWASWGIKPDMVVGHSVGEITAAHVSNALSVEEAARLVVRRARLMQAATGKGRMASVDLPFADAQALAREIGGDLTVTAENGPSTSVLGGSPDVVARALSVLGGRGIDCKELPVDYAFHTPQMAPFVETLEKELDFLKPRPGFLPFVSTVTGAVLSGRELGARYWARQIVEPVRLHPAVKTTLTDEPAALLEVGPHPVLAAGLTDTARAHAGDVHVLATLKRKSPERATMAESLAALHSAGHPVPWHRLHSTRARVVELPQVPWQHERFWYEPELGPARSRGDAGHPMLDARVPLAATKGGYVVAGTLDLGRFPFLADHRVGGRVVFPGAAYADLAIAVAEDSLGGGHVALTDFALNEMLELQGGAEVALQVRIEAGGVDGGGSVQIFSSPRADAKPDAWVLHAGGRFVPRTSAPVAARLDVERARARCQEVVDAATFYDQARTRGLDYGPRFQGVRRVFRRDGEALAEITLPEGVRAQGGLHRVHPSLLDACLQVTFAALRPTATTFVPIRFGSVRLFGDVAEGVLARAVLESDDPATASEEASEVRARIELVAADGRILLEVDDLVMRRAQASAPAASIEESLYVVAWRESDERAPSEPTVSGTYVVVAETPEQAAPVAARLNSAGAHVITLALERGLPRGAVRAVDGTVDSFVAALRTIAMERASIAGVVAMLGVPAAGTTSPSSRASSSLAARASALAHLAAALSRLEMDQPPRLYVATVGAQPVVAGAAVDPEQTALFSMALTFQLEVPQLRCVALDLEPADLATHLVREVALGSNEDRVAWRGGKRRVARLAHFAHPPPLVRTETLRVGDVGYALDVGKPGLLDTVRMKRASRTPPLEGEVEIRVRASGVNFRDVMIALGMYPGLGDARLPVGTECAGVVTAVGPGVTSPKVGDEVVATGFHTFDGYVVTRAELAAPKPKGISFEEAAGLPTVLMTVHYALNRVARLERGEKILVHSAAGGIGLAAIQYAKHVGAEVFATVGTEEKRALMKELGVTHVMDSRSLTWASDVLEATGGRGVDVVLNSLAGAAIPAGLSVLAPFGRFVELGKRDIYENAPVGLAALRNNVTVSAVALDQLIAARPEAAGALLEEVLTLVASGVYRPLPTRAFPATEIGDAFRYLTQGTHIGKVVVTSRDELEVEAPATNVRADATYLVTGGLGGLGLTVAQRLARAGAKHVALLSRREPSPEVMAVLGRLRAAGCEAHVLSGDVADERRMTEIFAELRAKLPPLAGIVHSAGVLDDGMLPTMTAERFQHVFAPKVQGTRILADLARPLDLDFFVAFSSVASVLGSPGQANYAAANAFLDGWAHAAAAEGRRVISVNWGPWAEVGMAAAVGRGDRLEQRGLRPFTPDGGGEIFDRSLLLTRDPGSAPEIIAMSFDKGRWAETFPGTGTSPWLSELRGGSAAGAGAEAGKAGFRAKLEETLEADRPAELEQCLREQLAAVLRSVASRIDVTAPFSQLGVDSLTSLELRNRLEVLLGHRVSATHLWNYPNVRALAAFLIGELGLGPVQDDEPPPSAVYDAASLEALSEISDEDAAAFFQEQDEANTSSGG